MKQYSIVATCLLIAAISCKQKEKQTDQRWDALPQVTELASLKQTDFAATLENNIDTSKNIIYAPSLLYAWEKIEEQLKSEVVVSDSNSADFKWMVASSSYQNALTKDEYTAEVELGDGGDIIARAFFNKTLPFKNKLETLDDPILFGNTKVAAFGMGTYYDYDAANFTDILYYQDDDHFILKLRPKDEEHEIILVKGIAAPVTLSEALKNSSALIEKGKEEKNDDKQSWKYQIMEEDRFAIPVIGFNIATNYKNIEEQSFLTKDNKGHFVAMAWQRTGFILNESGAVVESEAVSVADSAGVEEPVVTHPKKMILDKPFLIIVKRVKETNPYFVMWVRNSELLIKK